LSAPYFLLGLNFDLFHPFKHLTYSVGAIYLTIYNQRFKVTLPVFPIATPLWNFGVTVKCRRIGNVGYRILHLSYRSPTQQFTQH
jgi:hypothetical protein